MIDEVIHKRTGNRVKHARLTKENVTEVSNWTQGVIVQERDSVTDEMFVGLNVPVNGGRTIRVSEGMHITKHFGVFYEWGDLSFNRLFDPLHEEPEIKNGFSVKPSTGFASE